MRKHLLFLASYTKQGKECQVQVTLQQLNQELSSIIFITANYSAGPSRIEDVNFNARYVNGNRRSNGIKMAHINLGSGYLVNNMNNIETIIGGYKPHI